MSDYLPQSQGLNGREGGAITLRDIAFIMFRRRWIVLAVALPIIAVASLGLFQNVGSFVASTEILLDLQAPEVPRWNTKAYVDYERSLSTYQHMATSVPVARLAATALEDSVEVIVSLDEGAYESLSNPGELAGFLQSGLDISPVGESSILSMRFGSPNARLSLMAVEACRDAFLNYSIRATKNDQAIEYYSEQVRHVRNEIDSLLVMRAEIISSAGYTSIKENLRLEAATMADLRSQWFSEMADVQYLESKAASIRRARKENPDYFPNPDKDHSGSILIEAKSEVEQYRLDLTELRAKFTDDHIEVKRLIEQLLAAERLLDREIEAYIQGFEVDADAHAAKAAMIQDQIDSMHTVLVLAPEIERRVGLLDTETNAMKELLEDLQIKRGEVQMIQQADERINMIIKLNEPGIEAFVSGSRRIAYFAIISLFGIVFAVIVAFIIDYQDHRVYSPEKLESELGVPVLGSVSHVSGGDRGS